MRSRTFATLLLAGVLTLFAATPAAAIPKLFWGVVPQLQQSDAQLRQLRQGGVDSVRLPVAWGSVQPSARGGFNWSGIDAQVGYAAQARPARPLTGRCDGARAPGEPGTPCGRTAQRGAS